MAGRPIFPSWATFEDWLRLASLSDDPKLLGAPTGWPLHVTDASLSAGAGFVVVITGNMMLMPGFPKVSRGASIDVDDLGRILNV